MISLTKPQRNALLVIQELTDRNGYGPSYAEIAAELGYANKGALLRIIHALAERDYIARRPHCARSIEILARVPMPEEPEFVGFFEPSDEQRAELARMAGAA